MIYGSLTIQYRDGSCVLYDGTPEQPLTLEEQGHGYILETATARIVLLYEDIRAIEALPALRMADYDRMVERRQQGKYTWREALRALYPRETVMLWPQPQPEAR